MATVAAPPSLTAEINPSAVSTVKQESEDVTPIANHPTNTSPQSHELETLAPAVPSPPLFISSITKLKDLSATISVFNQCFDDLHNLLHSIEAAISSKLPPETPDINPLAPSIPIPVPDVSEERVLQNQQQEQNPRQSELEGLCKIMQNPRQSELEGLCKIMCSRGLRKYLVTHLSDLPKLREEVPNSLKLAPNPPKLVLECLGKFYLQGSKAFTRDSPMIPAREASILVLEYFLLMIGLNSTNEKGNGVLDIEKAVREEAESAALAWRKRLVVEGGLAKASQIDARGLLLFVACFGIPASFKREDVRDLIIAADAKEIAGVLQNSRLLMNKIPEIVEGMIKNKKEVDAVDIVYTFGLEERFNPQTVLISYLRESKESRKKPKKGNPAGLNEANKKQLAALKSISKCLGRHNIDPAKLLSGWQINEKIATLEKEIEDFDKKSGERTAQKRKASETETSKKSKTQEAKRSRHMGHGQQQQQKAAGHVDSRRNLLDGGHPSLANNYPASQSMVYGGPESMIPPGYGAGMPVPPESMIPPGFGAGMSVNSGGILSTGTYAGVHGGMLVDAGGQVINRGPHPYAWHGESAINERYGAAGQAPGVGLGSLYRASTSIEGFVGVPNPSSVGVGSRSSASDLYQFADSIVESESRNVVAGGPTAVPTHHSSYLYQV